GDDVAFDRRLQQRPLEPGRIAQMAARDPAASPQPQPDQDIAAKALDEGQSFALSAGAGVDANRPAGQAVENLLDQREALLDLADADPDAGIHVALRADRHLEAQRVVRRIGEHLPRIESAARRTADIPARTEL